MELIQIVKGNWQDDTETCGQQSCNFKCVGALSKLRVSTRIALTTAVWTATRILSDDG